GFGIGAASCMKNVRWENTNSLHNYFGILTGNAMNSEVKLSDSDDNLPAKAEDLREEIIHLSIEEQMEETMFLGLRQTRGISLSAFEKTFGKAANDVYGDVIDRYIQMGMLQIDDDRLFLTSDGMSVSNPIRADFLL
ncbi:MAG: radical SAM protein, partial [Lachnospiraceae bacterium]|nr:radical SAM protein [Lachnospiraceae bacterium]